VTGLPTAERDPAREHDPMTGDRTTAAQPAGGPVRLRDRVRVRVDVPATSANLGPGFDAFGLALELRDEIEVVAEAAAGPSDTPVEVEGAAAGTLPRDETHLVHRAIVAGLLAAGVPADQVRAAGLRLRCRNRIPHGRGLGSSAAAVVAGLLAARGLLEQPDRLDDDTVLGLATGFEGHPDNAAAAILGGFTISWMTTAGPLDDPPRARAVRLEPHPGIRAVVCVPAGELATSRARKMLPAEVPHADAAFNAGRSGLLVEALTRRPELLLEATEDRLHQHQRAAAMPQTAVLLERLRAAGGAAVVSGAGPSVLVLGDGDGVGPLVESALALTPNGQAWQALVLEPSRDGARVGTEPF
jgi:homoserine kinase